MGHGPVVGWVADAVVGYCLKVRLFVVVVDNLKGCSFCITWYLSITTYFWWYDGSVLV